MNDNQNQLDKRFLVLGEKPENLTPEMRKKQASKILKKDEKQKREGFWATLGWKDDKKRSVFNYTVYNSVKGNTSTENRDVLTSQIIHDLHELNPKINTVEKDVIERYIDLEKADFDVDWNTIKTYGEIPELRLDLFLEQNQGALVYYYHQNKSKLRQLNDDSVVEEFIQCQPTPGHTTERDRLTYFFKALPPLDYQLDSKGNIDWDEEERHTSFIIKIVVFKRSSGTPDKQLSEFFDKKAIKQLITLKGEGITYDLFGKKKNRLLIYDNNVESSIVDDGKNRYEMAGAFYFVDKKHKIDRGKKTLLLIHGTFSSTYNTFEGLVKLDQGGSELKDFLRDNKYEQVIAFDHPTISADVFQNIKDLKKLLGKAPFKQTVSVLAASRGCILSQAIGADKTLPFKVDKCLMLSPANGVGYFDLGDYLAKGLGILKRLNTGQPAQYIFALLQFSAKYFLDQPGAQQMTFGSKALTKVIDAKPVAKQSAYTAVINDWEKILVDKWLKRQGMKLADGAIKLVLGLKHDFVVGVKGQRNLPKAFSIDTKPMASIHCKYFNKGELHERDDKAIDLSNFMRRYL